MEIGTGLTALGAAIGSKDLVVRILGPTADYLGSELQGWTEKRFQNLKYIFEVASKRIEDANQEPSGVAPRLLKHLVDEASYCDDELMGCYFGGILASAATAGIKDDRSVPIVKLIEGLSSVQIRAHFVSYASIYRANHGDSVFGQASVLVPEHCQALQTFIPWREYEESLELPKQSNYAEFLSHSLMGLQAQSLVQEPLVFAENHDFLLTVNSKAPAEGVIVTPSPKGVELFLWATGNRSVFLNDYIRSDLNIPSLEIPHPENPLNVAPNSYAFI